MQKQFASQKELQTAALYLDAAYNNGRIPKHIYLYLIKRLAAADIRRVVHSDLHSLAIQVRKYIPLKSLQSRRRGLKLNYGRTSKSASVQVGE